MLGEAMARHLAFPHCSTPFARDRQARTSTGKFARTMQQEGGRCSSPTWVRSAQRHRDSSPSRQGRATTDGRPCCVRSRHAARHARSPIRGKKRPDRQPKPQNRWHGRQGDCPTACPIHPAHANRNWSHATLPPENEIGRAHVELQSLMRISYAVFCFKKKKKTQLQCNQT